MLLLFDFFFDAPVIFLFLIRESDKSSTDSSSGNNEGSYKTIICDSHAFVKGSI